MEINFDKQRPMFDFIRNMREEEVNKLLSNPSEEPWTYFDDSNNSILHKAVYSDFPSIALLIINRIRPRMENIQEKNQSFIEWINYKNNEGYSALHYACFRGQMKVIKLLIECGADYSVENKQGQNLIHVAAQGNKVVPLIYFKEKYNLSLTEKDFNGSTALHWSSYTGAEEAFDYLIHEEIEFNKQDNEGLTALHLAVISERTKIIKKLIFKGADHRIKDKINRTPLDLAIEKDKVNIVKILKKTGKCNIINVNLPLQKLKKEYYNMAMFIFFHIIFELIGFFVLIPPLNSQIIGIVYLVLIAIIVLSYTYLIFSNPGNPKKEKITLLTLVENEVNITEYCTKCIARKPPKTLHCLICNKCIEDFDHHCFWVNNCVGKKNKGVFFFMLFMITANLVLNLYLGVKSWFLNYPINFKRLKNTFPKGIMDQFFQSENTILGCSIALFIVTLFFFIPVLILLVFNVKNVLCVCKSQKKLKSTESNTVTIETGKEKLIG